MLKKYFKNNQYKRKAHKTNDEQKRKTQKELFTKGVRANWFGF